MPKQKTRAGQWLARFYLANDTNRSRFARANGLSHTSLRAMEFGEMRWNPKYLVAIFTAIKTEAEAAEFGDAIALDELDISNAKAAESRARLAELMQSMKGEGDEK